MPQMNFTSMENLDSISEAIEIDRHDDFWKHNDRSSAYGTDKKTELVRLAVKYLQMPNKDYSFDDLRNDESLSESEFDDRNKILQYFIDDPPHIQRNDGGQIYISNGLHRAEALRIAQEQTGITAKLPVGNHVSSVRYDEIGDIDIKEIDMIQMSPDDFARLKQNGIGDLKAYDNGIYVHGKTIQDPTEVTITADTHPDLLSVLRLAKDTNIDINVSSSAIRHEDMPVYASGKFMINHADETAYKLLREHVDDILTIMSENEGLSDDDSRNQKLMFQRQPDGSCVAMFSDITGMSQSYTNLAIRQTIENYLEENMSHDVHCDAMTEKLTNCDIRTINASIENRIHIPVASNDIHDESLNESLGVMQHNNSVSHDTPQF